MVIEEFSNAYFGCESLRKPKWFFNNKVLEMEQSVSENILIVGNITTANQGTYECFGTTNYFEEFYAKGELYVRGTLLLYFT